MHIYLSKTTRIEAEDGQNFILQTRHVRAEGANAGKAYWKSHGFYANLGAVARGAVEREIATGSKKLTWTEFKAVYDLGISRVVTACEGAVSAQLAAKLKGDDLSGYDWDEMFDDKKFPENQDE